MRRRPWVGGRLCNGCGVDDQPVACRSHLGCGGGGDWALVRQGVRSGGHTARVWERQGLYEGVRVAAGGVTTEQ